MSKFYIGPRDPQPKRRKSKDNPYNIFSVDKDTDQARYFVEFVDGSGHYQQEEISRELFELMNDFELEDLSYLNEVDRHYEQSEQTEEELNQRALIPPKPLEEELLENLDREQIRRAVARLSDSQQRRILLYYFNEMTLEEIAEIEKCSSPAIYYSIINSLKKIKKFFLNET